MHIVSDFEPLRAIADEVQRRADELGVYLPRVHDTMTVDELLVEMERLGIAVGAKVSQASLIARLRKINASIVNKLFGTDLARWSPFMRKIHAGMGDYFERKKFPVVEGLITQAVLATARNAYNWFHFRSEEFNSWEGRLRALLKTLPDFKLLTRTELKDQARPDFDANTVHTREKSPDEVASENELARVIVAQAGLTPDEFQVLRQRVLNRVPPRKVAKELGKKPQEIYRLKAKAKNKLKAFMRTCWGEHADIRWMYFIEGKTEREIADQEKISEDEVRHRLRDANESRDRPFESSDPR